MANRSRAGLVDKILSGKGPIRPRSLALLFMFIGALGFTLTLVMLDGQTICLFISTVVVFAGLGIIVLARKYTGYQLDDLGDDLLENDVQGRRTDRRPAREDSATAQSPAPASWRSQPDGTETQRQTSLQARLNFPQGGDAKYSGLNEKASAVFARQGASVFISQQRGDRSILSVESSTGMRYVVMIDQGQGEIDVSDLRALNSVMINEQADRSIFLSAATFTPQAQNWAEKKPFQLFEAYQVDLIRLD